MQNAPLGQQKVRVGQVNTWVPTGQVSATAGSTSADPAARAMAKANRASFFRMSLSSFQGLVRGAASPEGDLPRRALSNSEVRWLRRRGTPGSGGDSSL